ncbi:MAG TPA: GlpM family protein [Candidatus Baltobacteraceae bacterium]|jgi:uncharacterized membrane protein (GlpM family)|nr:GlpM family protein [Candidatus Baltobacteraceae bacterium]
MRAYLMYFLVGGTVTTLIVALEQSGQRLISGLAALFPVFTLAAYIFIGQTRGGAAVGQHSWLVLLGTLAAWVPYMVTVALLAPRIGTAKAIPAGLAVFLVCATGYLWLVDRNGWFR